VKILHIRTKDSCAAYLSAMGIGEGDEVEVVRRAPFGGPVQVRLPQGAEFVVGNDVAERITVLCGSHVHSLRVRCTDCG
jgi:Fe2+ transport system protein FeoA